MMVVRSMYAILWLASGTFQINASVGWQSESEQPAHDFGDPSAMEYVEEERVRPKRWALSCPVPMVLC